MPAATANKPAKVYAKKCAVCRQPFEAKRSTAKTCCQTCRQKLARRSKGADPATAARRRLKTKKATKLVKTCQHCGKAFKTTAAASKRQYCQSACRQAAYRQRKAEAVAALCIVATVEGYSAEAVRQHVSSWSLQRLERALSKASPARGVDWGLVATVASRQPPAQRFTSASR